MAKKIKVRITDKVASYTTDGKKYYPGDEVTIDSSAFCASFMEEVKPQKETPMEEVKSKEIKPVSFPSKKKAKS